METLFDRFMMAVIMTFGGCAAVLSVILTIHVIICYISYLKQ